LAAYRNRNGNFIAWEAVPMAGIFTAPVPPDATHEMGIVPEWSQSDVWMTEADADIAMGRVARFKSLDAMLESLKT